LTSEFEVTSTIATHLDDVNLSSKNIFVIGYKHNLHSSLVQEPMCIDSTVSCTRAVQSSNPHPAKFETV